VRKFLVIALVCLIVPNIFAVYQTLEVDGLRVTIEGIRFDQGYADSTTIARINLNKQVDLTDNPNDVLSEAVDLQLEFGESALTFDTISITMIDGVDIKGHTYVAGNNQHIYTSSTGIKNYSSTNPVFSQPTDYGYFHVSYFYDPDGQDAADGRTMETTFLTEMTTVTEAPTISLLVDTFRVAYYWDGTDESRHGFVSTMSSAFPTGTPVISLTYVPFYVAVNENVTSETYVVGTTLGDVTEANDNFNMKRVMFMTVTFAENGSFYIGRTANWDGLEVSLHMPQFVLDGSQEVGDTYAFDLNSYDNNSGGWTNDSTITGFSRVDVGSTGSASLDGNTIYYQRMQ